jgi:hypothetical protein
MGGTGAGSSYEADELAVVFGTDDTIGARDPLPRRRPGCTASVSSCVDGWEHVVDDDGDTHPGVTLTVDSEPEDLIEGEAYTAYRTVDLLRGTAWNSRLVRGEVVPSIEYQILDSDVLVGGAPRATELVRKNIPVFDVPATGSTFVLLRADGRHGAPNLDTARAGEVSCAEILAAALAGLLAIATIWLIWGVALSPLLLPMVREASQWRFMVPDPMHSRLLSADLLAFVTPQGFHPLWGAWARTQSQVFTASISEYTVFAGYSVLALAAFGALDRARGAAGRGGRFWLLVLAVFFVLALGPVLHIGGRTALLPGGGELPLPYGWLARTVPFMEITRSVSRYDIMVMLALSVLAGQGVDRLWRGGGRRRWLAGAACARGPRPRAPGGAADREGIPPSQRIRPAVVPHLLRDGRDLLPRRPVPQRVRVDQPGPRRRHRHGRRRREAEENNQRSGCERSSRHRSSSAHPVRRATHGKNLWDYREFLRRRQAGIAIPEGLSRNTGTEGGPRGRRTRRATGSSSLPSSPCRNR